jgi:predicted dehydrogenase
MINVGIVGVGHLGEIHLKLILSSKYFNLVGFYETDKKRSSYISNEYNVLSYDNLLTFADLVDAVVISTPTYFHYEIAKFFLEKNTHVFIEKPITTNIKQANELISIKNKFKLVGQVGHVERFNGAFLEVEKLLNPMFIESHRLSSYPSRGTDVSVVLDLMIHDIDIVLSIVDSKLVNLSANGTKIISNSPDIANARIEFENGCVANLTASRLSLKKMRKMRIFQSDSYISIDFDKSKSEIVNILDYDKKNKYAMTIHNNDGVEKEIKIKTYDNLQVNAIVKEHQDFARSIIENKKPKVSFETGRNALELAFKILDEINKK